MPDSTRVLDQSQRTSTFFKIALTLALLGGLVAGYATYHHLLILQNGKSAAACNINATFSCDAVALSAYSEFWGIPLAVWGLAYFISLIAICVLALKNRQTNAGYLHTYILFAIKGVSISLILAYIAFAILKVGCINCISIYVIALLQVLLVIFYRKIFAAPIVVSHMLSPIGTSIITTGLVVLVYGLAKQGFVPQSVRSAGDSSQIAEYAATSLSLKTEDIPLSRSKYSGKGEDYRHGGDEAKVVIHTFSDLQCPACMHMSFTLDQLLAEFGDRILIVYRNYPLDNSCNSAIPQPMHQYACQLALMARCSGLYGKFWQYHDLAFKEQRNLNPSAPINFAKTVGLTDKEIAQCQTDGSLMEKIKEDIALGNKVGVDATPTLFINGKQFMGNGYEALRFDVKSLLDKEE